MITKVIIRNFHKHKRLVLNFRKGLNVITGETDAGKSASLRAIYWVLYNRPLGDKYVRDDAKVCEVTVEFDDGNIVTRRKSASENIYILNGKKMIAGAGGPPEVTQKILNMKAINYQDQWDPPFMLSMTDGEVARYLNEVSGLSQIDSSLAFISSKARAVSNDLKKSKILIKQRREEVEQFSFVNAMEKQIENLEHVREKHEMAILSRFKIHTSLNTYKEKKRQIDGLSWLESAKKEVSSLEQIREQANGVWNRLLKIKQSLKSYQAGEIKITRLNHLLDTQPEIKELEKIQELKLKKKQQRDEIGLLLYSYEKVEKRVGFFQSIIEESTKDLKKIMPKICPLCDQEIP